ncbi:MAG TPA: adenylosuccinate synthase [Thermoplasmata archaeon]|nr:adenylosuccinate synthase [Thermoplasmata archaeon]
MPVTVVVGAQFGDEAKGKITDYLAANYRYVVRTGGGPNAGHSIELAEGQVVLHQLPSGILRSGVTCIDGPGMVIDPFGLETELHELDARGLLRGRLVISDRAHVILPIHRLEDAWEERIRAEHSGGAPFGTTLRGIGPAYADRAGRFGIRFADLVRPSTLQEKLAVLYASKEHLKDLPPREQLQAELAEVGARLGPRVEPTEPILWEALRKEEPILLEGAQSALLDIDFGTYPYVTSSHPTSAGALAGSGIPPQEVTEVVGVSKAYATRVGAGPFPTEETGPMGEFLQREGRERGATTGRTRRCGWLDLVLLRFAARLNGFTSLALTKVDVLGGLEEIPVCVAYEGIAGQRTEYPPTDAAELQRAKPVYDRRPGWPEFTPRLKERLHREGVRALPTNLRRYLEFLTAETGVPVEYVGFGPHRDETLWMGRGGKKVPPTQLSGWSS